jgi:hypothetical protein
MIREKERDDGKNAKREYVTGIDLRGKRQTRKEKDDDNSSDIRNLMLRPLPRSLLTVSPTAYDCLHKDISTLNCFNSTQFNSFTSQTTRISYERVNLVLFVCLLVSLHLNDNDKRH